MPKYRDDLPAKRLRELLDYIPETGEFRWKISRGSAKCGSLAGSGNGLGYEVIRVDGKTYLSHRLAWLHTYGCWPADELDHINGVRDDNRIANLREATHAENSQNISIRSTNTSRHTGVVWDKRRRKWQSRIMVNGAACYLGYFTDFDKAVAARVQAKAELHAFQPTERKVENGN